jgi:hypothetical protein
MKKINISNEIDGRIFSAEFNDDIKMNAWIDDCILNNYWGLPERLSLNPIEGRVDFSQEVEDVHQMVEGETSFHTEYHIKADYVIEIIDLDNNYEYLLAKCYENRRAAYPPIENYVDGIVKGDTAQVQDYIDACLLVKATYPKPTQE